MIQTIYASFSDAVLAEKATDELLRYGARKEDVSLITHDEHVRVRPQTVTLEGTGNAAQTVETRPENLTGPGIGSGVLAGMSSLLVPGFGVVLGGGALASAIGAAVATTAVSTGEGVTDYLKEQGVPDDNSGIYQNAIDSGGAILAIHLPSGPVDLGVVREALAKYGAETVKAI